METKFTKLGSTLLVPCVQEIVKQPLTKVPPRYLRSDQDYVPFISNTASLPQIPVADMSRLFSQDSMDAELDILHQACKDWGFFQLINHRVSTSLVEKVKMEIQEFFNLPMEEKKKYWQKPGDMEGFGQAFVGSEQQKLDWGDMFYFVTLPPELRKPHLFPMLPLPLRGTSEAYSREMKNLAMKILNLMAKPLGMEPKEMREIFGEGFQKMRMNYYHPCPQPELVTGLTSHSDAVGLTILLQGGNGNRHSNKVNEVEGLQIKKDGKWVPVKPIPNAFIVNLGDILEIVTNGIYKNIEHRATVNSVKERISIATFLSPRLDGEMGPAPPERPALFKKIDVADFFRGFFFKRTRWKIIP